MPGCVVKGERDQLVKDRMAAFGDKVTDITQECDLLCVHVKSDSLHDLLRTFRDKLCFNF